MPASNEVTKSGAALRELRVLWKISRTAISESWISSLTKEGLNGNEITKDDEDEEPTIVWAYALPLSKSRDNLYLYFDVHQHISDDTELHCQLCWYELPNTEPPGDVLEIDKSVGGIEGLLEILAKFWPFGSSRARITADYSFNGRAWGSRSLTEDLGALRMASGQKYRKAGIMWTVDETDADMVEADDTDTLTSVMLVWKNSESVMISAQGSLGVNLTDTIRQVVEKRTWSLLQSFLEEQ